MTTPKILAIPCKLDAFILNAEVCGGTSTKPEDDKNKHRAKIAPLSQPNYTFLRYERKWIQNDILDFTDLHRTGPAPLNIRFTDLGTGLPHKNRQGVYIHWIVPRPYRTGSTISQSKDEEAKARDQRGFLPRATEDPVTEGDTVAPDFLPAPSRWLIIRKVHESEPKDKLPEVDAWVVESDRRQLLDKIPTTSDVDLQVDFSPYIRGGDVSSLDNNAINEQAEVFIGHKENAATWQESVDNPQIPPNERPLRVELNLLNSSNQLFPDYQPHNSNVFSTIDTLQYEENREVKVVESAKVSYYVLGWHSEQGRDPFGSLNPNGKVDRQARLTALNMILNQSNEETKKGILTWLTSKDPTSIVCHGAMYDVQWRSDSKPPIVPADIFYEKLNSDMPVSVGTTPMDALLTYIKSHSSPTNDSEDDIKKVEESLLRIEKLLRARDDGVDAQDEAEDMVNNWNYAAATGGDYYFLSNEDEDKGRKGRPTQPDDRVIKALVTINSRQRYVDGLQRQLQLLRWDMFAFWWQYITDLNPVLNPNQMAEKVREKSKKIETMQTKIGLAQEKVLEKLQEIPNGVAQKGVLLPFYQARDPTMLVAGIESGWPWDYLDDLKARVDTQFYYSANTIPDLDPAWTEFLGMFKAKLPAAIQDAMEGLIGEFVALDPRKQNAPTPQKGYAVPLYHDLDKTHFLPNGTAPWRDRWENSQAWFPLFLEWQAEYTHVPLETEDPYWTLAKRSAWLSKPEKLRYGIAPGVELADIEPPLKDKRTVSGRVLILPQPNLNLQTLVAQVLEVYPDALDADQKKELKEHLHELAFLSSPLAGFTDHLLTRIQGNHIKPNVRLPNASNPKPYPAAISIAQNVDFKATQLEMMGIETDLTPYGTMVTYLDPKHCPFKPATHGQVRFTALNVIDKFGQAITAIDQTPRPVTEGPPPLYPCISEYYAPGISKNNLKVANTVVQDPDGKCQYFQVPPTINQQSRLNSVFMDYSKEGWKPLTEWDNPVWGWVVPNYADSGIQLFLPDGTFFREIRLGGPSGATASGTWLPFQPPESTPTDPNILQLQLFADELSNLDYLRSFVAMLNMSMTTAAAPPTAYSEFLSSLVGKPLALVKPGYSLELATDQYLNTCTIQGVPAEPEMPLLPSAADPKNHYRFNIQFGDPSRVYDGLIAYFLPSISPVPGNVLQLKTLFTHFVPGGSQPTPNLTKIRTSNYPEISPFWIDPLSDNIVNAEDPGVAYSLKWANQLHPLGAIVDPFVPMHAYTGILPTGALQLPNWTWQMAFARMTAFFHMGPLLTTLNAPKFNADLRLTADYDLSKEDKLLTNSGLGIPNLQAGKWAWLQPYSIEPDGREGNGPDAKTEFMAMDMAAVDERPRFEPAPYTALEGYLQLRQAIGQAVDAQSS